jgi:AcrR family transcriptional regulator
MSQIQVSDVKKQQIVKAAHTILVKNGYAATTISQVAAEAGVSRGLLHYYFKNKEDILATVVRTNMESSADLAHAIFVQSKTADELAANLMNGLREMLKIESDVYNLFFESHVMARQSPLIANELKILYRKFRHAVHRGLENANQRGIIAPHFPLEGPAALITGIIDGIWIQMVTEPELAENQAVWDATEASFKAVLTRSASKQME